MQPEETAATALVAFVSSKAQTTQMTSRGVRGRSVLVSHVAAAASAWIGCGDSKRLPPDAFHSDAFPYADATSSDTATSPFTCESRGQLDMAFGANGVTTPIFGLGSEDAGTGRVASLVFDQANDRILIGGSLEVRDAGMELASRFAVVALRADGTLDPLFGVGGKTVVGVGQYKACWLNGIALQSDGHIIGVGACSDESSGHFALVRFHANGTLDATFGSGGSVVNQPTARGQIESLAIDANDRIVVAGQTSIGADEASGTKFVTARYEPTGVLDSSFGSGGVAEQAFSNGADVAWDLALQSDGRIVVVGAAASTSHSDFGFVRYHVNGMLDTSFGTGGVGTLGFGSSGSTALDIDIDAANRAIVIGDATTAVGITRLENGHPDPSFGTTGSVESMSPVGAAFARARIGDGFYSAGWEFVPGGVRGVVGSFKPDGSADYGFGTNGLTYASVAFAPAAFPSALIVTPDDRILIAGTTVDPTNDYKNDFFAARFCP